MCLMFLKKDKSIKNIKIALPNASCNVVGEKENFEISITSQNAIEYKFRVEKNEIVDFWQTGMTEAKKYEV